MLPGQELAIMEARAKVTIKTGESKLPIYATGIDYLAKTGRDLTDGYSIEANEVLCGRPQLRHDQRRVDVYIDSTDQDNVVPFDVIKGTFEKLFFSHIPFKIVIEYLYGRDEAFTSQNSFDGWVIECRLSSINPGIRVEHPGSSRREPEVAVSEYCPARLHIVLYAVLDDERRYSLE
jgi:hypothetical protein